MHLKILLVPFLIIMILYVAIGYIQPDYMVVRAKKLEITTKQEQVSNMETLLSNIGALSGSLDTQKESENFVLNYFPRTLDQGRVIDALNYSAIQSGVIVEGFDISESVEQLPETQTALTGLEVPVEPALNPDGTPMLNPDGTPLLPPAAEEEPKSYTMKITVKGSYDNIKNFFGRAAHVNRYHVLKNLTIGLSKEEMENLAPDVNNGLVGSFEANFDYMPLKQTQSALTSDVFTRSQLNLDPLQDVLSWTTNSVPILEKPTTGKPNPFQ